MRHEECMYNLIFLIIISTIIISVISRSWIKSVSLGTSNDHDQWRGYPAYFADGSSPATWMWGREDQGFTTVICRKSFGKKREQRLSH